MMRRFRVRDVRNGKRSEEVPMLEVFELSDYSDEEVNRIADMKVGDTLNFGRFTVERTA